MRSDLSQSEDTRRAVTKPEGISTFKSSIDCEKFLEETKMEQGENGSTVGEHVAVEIPGKRIFLADEKLPKVKIGKCVMCGLGNMQAGHL